VFLPLNVPSKIILGRGFLVHRKLGVFGLLTNNPLYHSQCQNRPASGREVGKPEVIRAATNSAPSQLAINLDSTY
jgi:hypothetical protein